MKHSGQRNPQPMEHRPRGIREVLTTELASVINNTAASSAVALHFIAPAEQTTHGIVPPHPSKQMPGIVLVSECSGKNGSALTPLSDTLTPLINRPP